MNIQKGDMMSTDVMDYKISQHAKQRFAERIMDKDDKNDINRFIVENEDKIKTDINKMIQFGEMIYVGKQSQKDGKGNVLNVYLKDLWVVLVDGKSETVVTLYKIDLGLDDEFNKAYVSKMMEKLNEYKKVLNDIQLQVQSESNMYRDMIDDNETQIKEYRAWIKNLEELSEGYKTIVDNNCVKISQANRDVTDTINKLIGKKEF